MRPETWHVVLELGIWNFSGAWSLALGVSDMYDTFQKDVARRLDEIRAAGTYKRERVIATPQDAHIRVADGQQVLNLCANNYLGLAEHPEVIAAAHRDDFR